MTKKWRLINSYIRVKRNNIIYYLIISPIPVLVAKGHWIKALTDHNRRENGEQNGNFNCAIHDFLGNFVCGRGPSSKCVFFDDGVG